MGIGKQHSFGRQSVHVRRPGLRIAVERVRPVVEIIDGDEQDVGFCLTRVAKHEQ